MLLAARAGRDASDAASGDLLKAFAFNAYADHFLEDSFAPGHAVVEDVWNSHIEVLRVHDRFNEAGRDFLVNRTAAEAISALIDTPEERASVLTCFQLTREHESERLKVAGALDRLACQLNESRDSASDCKTSSSRSILLVGDDRVYYENEGKSRQVVRDAPEAAFLALVVSLSIRDVAEAFLGSSASVFAAGPCSCEREASSASCKDVDPSRHELGCFATGAADSDFYSQNAIGYFPRAEDLSHSENMVSAGGAAGDAASMEASPESAASLSNHVAPEPRDWMPVTLAGTAQLQRLNEGSRKVFSLEGIVSTGWPEHSQHWDVGLGYTYIRGNSYEGHGADLNFYYRLKQLGVYGGPELGYRFLYGDGRSFSRPHIGGRIGLDIGLVSLFFSLASDASIENGRAYQDWTTWSFGITGSVPPSSLDDRIVRPLGVCLSDKARAFKSRAVAALDSMFGH